MPIEITELVIKAQVGDSGNNTNASNNEPPSSSLDDQAKYQMLEKAVEKAVNIIKRKNER